MSNELATDQSRNPAIIMTLPVFEHSMSVDSTLLCLSIDPQSTLLAGDL